MTFKQTIGLIIAGFVVGLGALVVAVALPLIGSIQNNIAETDEFRDKRERTQRQLAALSSFSELSTEGRKLQKRIESRQKKVAQLRTRVSEGTPDSDLEERLREEKKRLTELRSRLSGPRQENNVHQAAAFFASREAPVAFISAIEQAGERSGISPDISALGTEQDGDTTLLRFRITASAPFSTLHTFIDTMEHLPYLLRVDTLTINREKEDEQTVPKLTMTISAYAR